MPNEEATALWLIQRWRTGHFGKFVLDEVTLESLERDAAESQDMGASFNQAMKVERSARKQKAMQG